MRLLTIWRKLNGEGVLRDEIGILKRHHVGRSALNLALRVEVEWPVPSQTKYAINGLFQTCLLLNEEELKVIDASFQGHAYSVGPLVASHSCRSVLPRRLRAIDLVSSRAEVDIKSVALAALTPTALNCQPI